MKSLQIIGTIRYVGKCEEVMEYCRIIKRAKQDAVMLEGVSGKVRVSRVAITSDMDKTELVVEWEKDL